MTDRQKYNFYFKAWSAAVKANGWKMKDRRLKIAEDRLTEEGRQVLAFARQRAASRSRETRDERRAPALPSTLDPRPSTTLDDLRHGAHVLALSRDKSSEDLTNAEMDRIVCLFNVLADPTFLGSKHKMGRLDWDAYQRGEDPGAMRRLHWVIESVPEAVARHIAASMIHRRDWEFATIADKRTLARRIAQWKKSKERPLARVASSLRDEDPDWNV